MGKDDSITTTVGYVYNGHVYDSEVKAINARAIDMVKALFKEDYVNYPIHKAPRITSYDIIANRKGLLEILTSLDKDLST